MAARDVVTRRLFLAFDLDEPCRQATERLVDQLARRLDSAGPSAKGRIKWVERENLHMTLRFLGATTELALSQLRVVLEPPFTCQQFELRFDQVGAFPAGGAPRVIWLGASAGAGEAETVQRELEQRLNCIGVPPEGRAFRAHLTLGRFREPSRPSDGRTIREFTMNPIGPFLVDHITLYESHLSNRGPSYDSLVRMPLGRWS